jgi:serine/threonine protein kinase
VTVPGLPSPRSGWNSLVASRNRAYVRPVSDAATDNDELLRAALAPRLVLVRKLGAGGMGEVYLARDPGLKRLVAVKVLSAELARDPEARGRFEREAESVAAIAHPNVVAVYSVGEMANADPYFGHRVEACSS